METRLFSWCRALEKSPDPERSLLLLHWICSCRWSLSRVQFLGHFLCIHAVCSIWWGQGLQRTRDAIWKFSILTVYMVRNLLVHHCFIGSGRRAGESQGWDIVLRTLRSCHGDRTVTVPKGERRGGWAGRWGGWHGIGSARWMIHLFRAWEGTRLESSWRAVMLFTSQFTLRGSQEDLMLLERYWAECWDL